MSLEPFVYNATIISVYDGDTITAEIDLGFNTSVRLTLRLARINTPELIGADKAMGLASREAARRLVLGKPVVVKTYKDKQEKYGRYLADIYFKEAENPEQVCLNDRLVSEGYAVYKTY